MLYFHCGWPNTGTASLQTVLSEHEDRLAEAGLLYPRQWRGAAGGHYKIVELLKPDAAAKGALDRFQDFLASNSGRAVLISSEALAGWFVAQKRPAFLELLRAARDVGPVTCLLTLRRADVLFVRRYLYRLLVEGSSQENAAYSVSATHWRTIRGFLSWLSGIAGMAEVSEALDGSVVYSKYEKTGRHHEETLRAASVDDPVRAEIMTSLGEGPRAHTRVTRKVATMALHLDAISEIVGAEISFQDLRRAWADGKLQFADDAPCELVELEVRRAIHEEALELSRETGFQPYIDFFGEDEIEPTAQVPLDLDLLTGDDLAQIASHLAPIARPMPHLEH